MLSCFSVNFTAFVNNLCYRKFWCSMVLVGSNCFGCIQAMTVAVLNFQLKHNIAVWLSLCVAAVLSRQFFLEKHVRRRRPVLSAG